MSLNFRRKDYDPAYFDSPIYKQHPDSQRNQNRLRAILTRKKRGKLLEVGCGDGAFLLLASKYFDAYGIDISPHALQRAPSSLQPRLKLGDVHNIRVPPKQFDIVAAFNILEHSPRPVQVVQKLRNALVPTGLLVGSVPCNASLLGSLYTGLSNFFDQTHVSTLAPQTWRSIFREAGFADICLFGEVPFGPNRSLHIQSRFWRHLSLNTMFVCRANTPAANGTGQDMANAQ
jgi:SAM-dependent methyltransferase